MLAIPLFGDDLAPRFCAADELLVVEVSDGGVAASVRRTSLGGLSWVGRLDQIAALGGTVMLCCGFNKGFLAHAEQRGIQVIWGLAGEARVVVEAYLEGDLEPHRLRCAGRYRGRGWAGDRSQEPGRQRRRGRGRRN